MLVQLFGSLAGGAEPVRHAAAAIDDQAHRNRLILAAEDDDGNLPGAVEDAKVLGAEPGDVSSVRNHDRDWNQRQIHVYANFRIVGCVSVKAIIAANGSSEHAHGRPPVCWN